jgi:GNAT superfamily N-acetyltransferase
MAEKARFTFRKIDHVPKEMVEKFKKEVSDPHLDLDDADVKIGAFSGDKLVGVCSGKDRSFEREGLEFELFLIKGVYIESGFRRSGLATRLIRRVGWEAKKLGFSEVKLDRMVGPTQRLIEKEKERGQKKKAWGKTKKIDIGPAGLGIGATITFKGRKKKPLF